MRSDNQRLLKVVYSESIVHSVPERFPVAPGRPQLEDVKPIVPDEFFVIRNKLGQTPCDFLEVWLVLLLANLLNGIQKELQGRHPLLAVNYFPLVDVLCRHGDLLENDGAQEVRTSFLLRFDSIVT